MVTSLVERVVQARSAAQQQADDLRTQLAAAEEQLRRLSYALEVMMEFAEDPVVGGDVVVEAELSDPADDHRDKPASALPPLRGFREQVVTLLATAEGPMRARQIVQAIGKPDTRPQVEGMRSRLQRLVIDGWLRRESNGLYTIAAGINGYAPTREAD